MTTIRERKLVVAGLARDGARVLITQRRADQKMPLAWEFPGGKIEPGEAPEAALARELSEELGVASRIDTIWEVVFHAYPEFDLYMLVYEVTLTTPPRAVEVADLAWVLPSEMAGYDILPADAPLIARLVRESQGQKP